MSYPPAKHRARRAGPIIPAAGPLFQYVKPRTCGFYKKLTVGRRQLDMFRGPV
ncbi:MAG: hypothetical protein LBU00_05010 [Treponema sp.]|nr:hypothetical protein [Treponema sp.]